MCFIFPLKYTTFKLILFFFYSHENLKIFRAAAATKKGYVDGTNFTAVTLNNTFIMVSTTGYF